jgi:hypothetical protein
MLSIHNQPIEVARKLFGEDLVPLIAYKDIIV